MFSNTIKQALDREIIGQPRAIRDVVRGVTRVASGLTPAERTFCAHMLVGPSGTGKTHLVRTLARVLHGDDRRLTVVDCARFAHSDPWLAFVAQLAPLFPAEGNGGGLAPRHAQPLSVVLVEYLERGSPEVFKALAAALETGRVMLPEGRRGSLRNCLIFLTTGLCAREILDEAPRIGFQASPEEEDDEENDVEEEKLRQICFDQTSEHFGNDLVGRLDGTIVFHKLQPEHLAQILDRRVNRLGQWLAQRGFRCELQPDAREFLLEHGSKDLRHGARDLVRAHRKYVEFPVADLLISGCIPGGGRVLVGRKNGKRHLHFTVNRRNGSALPSAAREVQVDWA